ncbi:MAG TPA: NAD-dependent dehydratase, partial [Planctomycetes bacterium]|nr:NAD-dependent dehydratase [Planctomycetota bacterium]
LTMAYHRHHGLDTRIVRIFNTYGPRMRLDDGRVLPAFLTQALRGEPLTVFGDGSQTRSFCFVDDLMEGIWRLFNSSEHYPVNLGNPREMTILEFAQKVVDVVGGQLQTEERELPEDDPKVRQPDISKATRLLDWEPSIQVEEGLGLCLDDFSRRTQSADSP